MICTSRLVWLQVGALLEFADFSLCRSVAACGTAIVDSWSVVYFAVRLPDVLVDRGRGTLEVYSGEIALHSTSHATKFSSTSHTVTVSLVRVDHTPEKSATVTFKNTLPRLLAASTCRGVHVVARLA